MEPEVRAEVHEERATRFWVASDGFVRSQIRPGARFVLEDSVAAVHRLRMLAAALPAPVLVDARGISSATVEAQLYFTGPLASESVAVMAVLVGSPLSRVIVEFFMRLVRPRFATRAFTSEAEAVAWLRQRAR